MSLTTLRKVEGEPIPKDQAADALSGGWGAEAGLKWVGLPCTRIARGSQPLSSTMPSMPEKVTRSPSRKWWPSASFLRVRIPGEPWRRSGLVQGCPPWSAAEHPHFSTHLGNVLDGRCRRFCLYGVPHGEVLSEVTEQLPAAGWEGSLSRPSGEGWETLGPAHRAPALGKECWERLGSWSLRDLLEQVWRPGWRKQRGGTGDYHREGMLGQARGGARGTGASLELGTALEPAGACEVAS